jgi:hypothetical protein
MMRSARGNAMVNRAANKLNIEKITNIAAPRC